MARSSFLVLWAAALAAPVAAQRPAGAAPAASQQPQLTRDPPPRTAYDSTVYAITALGTRVAEVRSGIELLRRAAFNEPDGSVLERADLMRTRCREMAAAAERGQQFICRGCQAPNVQGVLDAYRSQLPAVARLARSCAARLEQLRGGEPAAAAAALRGEARPLSARLAEGLRPYEQRLEAVRRAFGWTQ